MIDEKKCPECGMECISHGKWGCPELGYKYWYAFKCGARIEENEFYVPCPNKGLEMNPAILRNHLVQKEKELRSEMKISTARQTIYENLEKENKRMKEENKQLKFNADTFRDAAKRWEKENKRLRGIVECKFEDYSVYVGVEIKAGRMPLKYGPWRHFNMSIKEAAEAAKGERSA